MSSILDKAEFQSRLERIAEASKRPISEVRAQSVRDLEEMRGKRNPVAVRLFAALGRFIYRRGYHHRPVFDLDEVERIKALSRNRSIVFLVTHKTYLDFFVLFDFLYRQGIPTPYIFGGLNMNFAGFGALARRAGGIFIRRTFGDDEIYKLVLRRYMESLIEDRACFMWAIEGTRSRTGKLLTPRLGLLNYLSDASRTLGGDAVSYVPVSVVYDQIQDVVDMAAQEAGAEKKPENLPWFMDYVRGMGGPFGYIHIRLGDAMAMTETPAAPDYRALLAHVSERRIEIQKLAFEVCYRINEITPATMTALVVMVLLCRGRCDAWQIQNDVTVLYNYIRRRKKRAVVKKPSRILSFDSTESVESLVATGVVRVSREGSEKMLEIAPDRVSVAIYYSNMAVHHFVISAFAELALISWAQSPATEKRDQLWAEYMRLRSLFNFEFFFSRNEIFRDQLRRELDSLHPNWRAVLKQGDEAVISLLKQKPLLVAAGVLSPFVAAYRVVGEMISQDAVSRELPDKEFIEKCLKAASSNGGHIESRSVPGVSRALLTNGLRVADHRGLRANDDPDVEAKRAAFIQELELTAQALSTLDGINHLD